MKKNYIISIILTVLGISLIATSFIVDFDKKGSNTNDTSNKRLITNNSTKILSNDDSRFIDIYNAIKDYIYISDRINGYSSFTDRELAYIALKDINNSDYELLEEKSSNREVLYRLDASKLIDNLKKYFGYEITFNKNSLLNFDTNINNVNIKVYSYDVDNDYYKIIISNVENTAVVNIVNDRTIISTTLKDNNIIVVEKAIYYDINNETGICKVYSDKEKKNLIEEVNSVELINVTNYLEKASTITSIYEYNKDMDSYYFYSSNINGA